MRDLQPNPHENKEDVRKEGHQGEEGKTKIVQIAEKQESQKHCHWESNGSDFN